MRRSIVTICLLLLCFGTVSGQDTNPGMPENAGERIAVFTDRTMYCVSEQIFYSVFYTPPPNSGSQQWSSTLYTELIRWDGTWFAQQKIRIRDSHAQGVIIIPQSVKSGTYYLKVYTKWMRNYSPYNYTYVPLKIVNPLTDEIDEGNELKQGKASLSKGMASLNKVNFSGLENYYLSRQLVELELSLSDDVPDGIFCVSVYKSESSENPPARIVFPDSCKRISGEEIEHLPEIRGISLSGKLLDKGSRNELPGESVSLSSTIDPFYFSSVASDSSGEFLFSIPLNVGSHQFALTASNSSAEVEFLVDRDFCEKELTLPFIPFNLSEGEKQLVREMAVNEQLSKKYSSESMDKVNREGYPPFYGKADNIIHIQDYIELVDLREFFFELVPGVSIEYYKEEPYLEFSDRGGSLSNSQPLILLDNIPIANSKTILDLPSKSFDRIEVINNGFVVGDNLYSGVISIFSKDEDLAGIDLRGNTSFFDYKLYNNEQAILPKYSADTNSRRADLRNLLYWNPALKIQHEKLNVIKFHTGDAPGEYTIKIQGLDKFGNKVVYNLAQFTVEAPQ